MLLVFGSHFEQQVVSLFFDIQARWVCPQVPCCLSPSLVQGVWTCCKPKGASASLVGEQTLPPIVFSRLVHVVACVNTSSFLVAK